MAKTMGIETQSDTPSLVKSNTVAVAIAKYIGSKTIIIKTSI